MSDCRVRVARFVWDVLEGYGICIDAGSIIVRREEISHELMVFLSLIVTHLQY